MQKGTSLIEVMVYIACTVLIFSLAGHIAFSFHNGARERTKNTDSWVQLALALNRMLDDIKQAPSERALWKKREEDVLIFPLNGQDCGWCLDRGRLIRNTGIYNKSTQAWSKRAISVVLDAAQAVSFKYRHHSALMVAGVRVVLVINDNKQIYLEGFATTKQKIPGKEI